MLASEAAVILYHESSVFFLAWTDIAHDPGRHAHRELSGGYDHTGRHHRAGADECSGSDLRIVQHNRADSDQRPTTYAATVNHRAVADRDLVVDVQRNACLRMNHRSVLNVHTRADANGRDVAADHDVMHDRA